MSVVQSGAATGFQESEHFDAVIVGAGWAGMYMLHRLRASGLRVRLLEAGSGVGGTWYWNRYPGARVDVPSMDYSYSFSEELQQEWDWTELYAAQPEIERYANHVADRFDLRRDIQFDTRVGSAIFEEEKSRWVIETDHGDRVTAKYCILGVGGYSEPIKPNLKGLDTFRGEMYFTARWPKEDISYAGKRIGVLGTGSSGMQTITAIAGEAFEHLYVFQRTANYASSPGRNGPLDPEYQAEYKRHYTEHREQSRASNAGGHYDVPLGPVADLSDEEFDARMWQVWELGGPAAFHGLSDVFVNEQANERVAEWVCERIRERVKDPHVAEVLTRRDHYFGARRFLVENEYYEVYNQPNVTLVDVKTTPIDEVTPEGLRVGDDLYELDMLICATGFDSGTGSVLHIDFKGVGGAAMSDAWADGPNTYLGLMVHGFPNLFNIAGPGSPSIRAHVIVAIEQHVEWIADFIDHMEASGIHAAEATLEAQAAWTEHVADVVDRTLLARDETQYVGANVPGKPRAYLAYVGGFARYAAYCNHVRDQGYEGFTLKTTDGEVPNGRVWSGPKAVRPPQTNGGNVV